ncbi:MAG TPA: DUF3047 domain-containing protein [Methylomirabilota bacterium]|jgi:hypothetical protein
MLLPLSFHRRRSRPSALIPSALVSTAMAALLLAATVLAADQVVIEDWSKYAVGTKGVPGDWKTQNWGKATYDFAVVEIDGKRALHLKSVDESSTIVKDIKGKVRLKETPVLEWRWRMVTLPKGGDSRSKATDDQAGQIYVVWPRFPESVRSRIIGYVWDTTAPAGTVVKSEKTGAVTYVVVRSGTADVGKWMTERRNIAEDYRKVYGEPPDDPGAVSISIDSNDTQSTAESYMGAIIFTRP